MRRFGYYWKEGLRNIFKHGFMSIAAIAIMVACLILTGTVTLIAYNIDLSIVDLQQSNEIVVWIDENLTTREAKDLQPQFEKIGNIATVEFEDRDVALEKYREELGEDASILEDYNSSQQPAAQQLHPYPQGLDAGRGDHFGHRNDRGRSKCPRG